MLLLLWNRGVLMLSQEIIQATENFYGENLSVFLKYIRCLLKNSKLKGMKNLIIVYWAEKYFHL